ncbi:hypothetical protein PFICI_11872 [Pestalotiopsis fici W106-1]|uniref:Cytochrome P450 n=1 Tax=Pestalotiopsis fici (strain W106-1 / CGMCC3.15140) TaxID=1229662 RepID=W3WRJ2_PESFW|nr:uncharacterized protein PFICI_11872 [Pestalotiopsis fici W106-1]ETS76485.1 hypothetical protein PFICI_11872 [Pestalotiopsis fici W106-1]
MSWGMGMDSNWSRVTVVQSPFANCPTTTMGQLQAWVSDLNLRDPLVAASLLILSLSITATIWKSYDSLSSFPGPRLAAWSRIYSVWIVLTGREHEWLLQAHDKYGPLVRWQPNLLLINDPTMLPKIYHLRANKTRHYNHSPSDVKGMVEESDWQKHRAKRHRIDSAFSPKAIFDNEELVDVFVTKWIDALSAQFATNGNIFDFSDWGNFLALDVVTKTFFGQEMGFIEHGDKNSILADTRANGPTIHALARLPRLKMFLLRSFGRFLVPTAGDGSGLGNVLLLRDQLYQERLNTKDKDLRIGYFLIICTTMRSAMKSSKKILGASDTTGHGIRCLIRNLLQHPPCLARLRREIDDTVRRNGGIDQIRFAHINSQMPYLSACIRESLRHDPPIVSFLPRWVDGPDGVELCGRFVPPGVEVACSPYVLSRNRDLYGPDVHSFRPERYSEASEEWVAKAARYDFVFGYGPRHCIGQRLSHFLTCKAIVQLFHHFDVDLIDPGSGKAFLNWNYSGLRLRLSRRANDGAI